MLHSLAVKIMVRPFVWANQRPRQNFLTRATRSIWRSL